MKIEIRRGNQDEDARSAFINIHELVELGNIPSFPLHPTYIKPMPDSMPRFFISKFEKTLTRRGCTLNFCVAASVTRTQMMRIRFYTQGLSVWNLDETLPKFGASSTNWNCVWGLSLEVTASVPNKQRETSCQVMPGDAIVVTLSADDALNTVVPDYLMLGLTYIGAARFCLEELKLVKEFVVLDRDRTVNKANRKLATAGGSMATAVANRVNAAVRNTGVQNLPNGGLWPNPLVPGMTQQTLILSNSVGNWKSVGHVRSLLSDDTLPREASIYKDQLTVYDLIAHVKKWLKIHGERDKSVVEVLQRKGWGKEYLGPAKVFLSHSQAEHPAEMMAGLIAAALRLLG
jgi:hypothetical protein